MLFLAEEEGEERPEERCNWHSNNQAGTAYGSGPAGRDDDRGSGSARLLYAQRQNEPKPEKSDQKADEHEEGGVPPPFGETHRVAASGRMDRAALMHPARDA